MKERILKKFEEEIQQLDRELKTELPKEIKRARELGDLSENAEYTAALEKRDQLASTAARLESELTQAKVITPLEERPWLTHPCSWAPRACR